MHLHHDDEMKITPISAIDINREKPEQLNHLLICTFSSIQAITLLKLNARKLSRAVKFNARVPPEYMPKLNEHLRTQNQLRQMRNNDGNPLVKSRLSTDRGHILLEVADRVGQGWSPFRIRSSFMPQSRTNIPQASASTTLPKYTLLQYRWDSPLNTEAQNSIKQLATTLDIENISFNHTNHLLNITTKHAQEAHVSDTIATNPHMSSSTLTSVAH